MAPHLLASVPEPQRSRVLDACRRRPFARGEAVFREGDSGDSVHIVDRGHLLVRAFTKDGDAVTLEVAGPGAVLGEIALVRKGGERTATVVALDDGGTLVLTAARFEELCAEHVGVAIAAAQLLADRVERLTAQLTEAIYVGVDRRVARRLLTLADTFGGAASGTEVPVTQQDIADLAGAARPTVNQSLKALESRGAIAVFRGGVRIVDIDVLRSRAGG